MVEDEKFEFDWQIKLWKELEQKFIEENKKKGVE